jgi:hypothetical protein
MSFVTMTISTHPTTNPSFNPDRNKEDGTCFKNALEVVTAERRAAWEQERDARP